MVRKKINVGYSRMWQSNVCSNETSVSLPQYVLLNKYYTLNIYLLLCIPITSVRAYILTSHLNNINNDENTLILYCDFSPNLVLVILLPITFIFSYIESSLISESRLKMTIANELK